MGPKQVEQCLKNGVQYMENAHVAPCWQGLWFFLPPLSQSYKPIVEFIDAQFEAYLQEELKIKRVLHNYHDTRIHACLYFIAPTGHSLKSLDLVTMKKLDSKVEGP